MDRGNLLLAIILMAVVTVIPRILPFWLLGNRKIPEGLIYWLSFVPVCLLGAIVLPSIFVMNGSLDMSLGNHTMWASFPALLAAIISRSIFPTIVVGMASLCFLRGVF